MRRTMGATTSVIGNENTQEASQADIQLPKKPGTKPMFKKVANPATVQDIIPDKINP